MTEVYQYLTLRIGLDPKYVLDEMQMYEVAPLFDKIYYTEMESWDQARMIAWMIAQVNSRKKIKIRDIAEFPWDDETSDSEKEVSKADYERLKAKAQAYADKYLTKEDGKA